MVPQELVPFLKLEVILFLRAFQTGNAMTPSVSFGDVKLRIKM